MGNEWIDKIYTIVSENDGSYKGWDDKMTMMLYLYHQ
jgi:hypothetical protein